MTTLKSLMIVGALLVGIGLLDRLDSDGFDYRLFHFSRGFLHWGGFGLGLGNRSLCRFRSLGCLTRLTALS